MGWGKILGGVALGVGAVAAAPFTGGGSILGAATLASSLAGAGAAAAGAGAVGAAVGAVFSNEEEKEKQENEKRIAEASKKASKAEKIVKAHKEHSKLILALSALGISMANADGEISPEEELELNEFVGGLSSQGYPEHIKAQIREFIYNPPSFNEALDYLENVRAIEYDEIRSLLISVMEADGKIEIMEKAYLQAFDEKVKSLRY